MGTANQSLNKAVALLAQAGKKARSETFGARPLVFDEAARKAFCDLYGGTDKVERDYPLLAERLRVSIGASPNAVPDPGHAENYVAVRDVACDAAFAGAIGDVSLAQISERLIVSLLLLLNGEVIASEHRVEERAATLQIEASAAGSFAPADVVEAVLVASWDGPAGGLCTCMARDQGVVDALDPVVGINPAHPVLRYPNVPTPPPIREGFPEKRLDRNWEAPYAHDTVNVCFNRVPFREYVDYQYGEARPSHSLEEMFLDMRGSVTLRPSTAFGRMVAFTAALVLPEGPRGAGQIVYAAVPGSRGDYVFPTSEGFDFAFPTDWRSCIEDSVITGMRQYAIAMTIAFKTADGASGTVRISSEPGVEMPTGKADHFALVPPIRLFWGCIEQDSLVAMADGSERPIRSIRPGERVSTPAGGSATVVDVLRGRESELVQLDLSSGRSLLLTRNHPVATQSAMKRAEDIVIADMLRGPEGAPPCTVVHHYPVAGSFEVYNLCLEGADAFVAEGIAVGDNDAQGRLARKRTNLLCAQASPELQKEIERMRADLIGS